MSDPFRYIFRFCCDPGFNDRSELESLERYVREARIDDVAVFANVQELNTDVYKRQASSPPTCSTWRSSSSAPTG